MRSRSERDTDKCLLGDLFFSLLIVDPYLIFKTFIVKDYLYFLKIFVSLKK